MKTFKRIKISVIAASIALTTSTFSTLAFTAIVMDNDYDTINGWQTSLAAEFSQLDSSGNGLLMPLEASKGKAFNKKTFAAADADKDGTIDQNEYVNYKTSMGAKDVPVTSTIEPDSTSNMQTSNEKSAKAVVDEPAPTIETAEMSKDSAEPNNRSVGKVIDDSVITTKAKAAIFNTPDLKTLDISVQTRQGGVSLTGTVASEADKIKAEEAVRNIGGVTTVTNSLQVRN